MNELKRVSGAVGASWLILNLAALLLLQQDLPFQWPGHEQDSVRDTLIDSNLAMLEALLLIAIIVWLTRNRPRPDLHLHQPAPSTARRELFWLAGYGVIAQIAGMVLATSLGWQQFSFHFGGTLHGAHDADLVSRTEVFAWAGFNLVTYVLIPLAIIARRHPIEALWLRSHDRRADTRLILLVLVIECLVQFAAISTAIFDLPAKQLVTGIPLSFVLFFIGTVIPTMIFVQALIVPRLLIVTGSIPWTVILGGLAYTLVHFFDAWMLFDSPRNIALSIAFLLLGYMGPGMVKAALTLRTGNVWVHVWAYHAIAPHTIIDTPLIVRIFRL